MPRFCAVVSLVLGTFLLAASAQAAAARPLDLPAGQPILFALQAEEGSFERTGRARFTLTLRDVVPQGVWFTDRPARDSGPLRAGAFFGAWRALGFRDDPPNAVLAVPAGRRRARAVAVELGAPRWDARAKTVTFRARVLRRATGGLTHLDDDLRGGVPARFRDASLFVDDVLIGSSAASCGYMAQVDLFPAQSVPLAESYLQPGLLQPIRNHQALFALIGTTFGGDGRITFQLPNPTPPSNLRYGICDYGIFPARQDDPSDSAQCTTGSISLQAQTYTAAGWVPADGRTLPIGPYRQLFNTIGTTFGGDGTSTFGVPNVPPAGNGLPYYLCANGYPFQAGQGTYDECFASELALFGTRGLPGNYLPANGATLSINQRQVLYALFGNVFGGDGITTFNLPNLPAPTPGTTWAVCSEGVWPS